jgi:hypothetical protein
MFIQVVQGKTTDAEGVIRQSERWQQDVKPGAVGYLGSTAGVADDGTFMAIVRFTDAAAAEANSGRPEQSAWWNEMEKYVSDVTFRNSSDVEQPLGPGSDTAGFVQVMQGRCTDRKRLAEIEAQFMPQMRTSRPDVIGSVRAWFDDNYVEAIYFSSEAEARKGEQTMPEEVEGVSFDEFMALTPDVAYIDLKNPILRSA